jgi:hypothetical protein
MRIVLPVSCNNEHCDAPSTAVLEITPASATALLDLWSRTVDFVKELDESGLACRYFDAILGLGDKLPYFELEDVGEIFPDAGIDDSAFLLSDEIKLPENPDGFRIECRRVRVGEQEVSFTALAKHGDELFTTCDLNIEVVRAIAQGRKPSLPVLTTEDR